MKKPNSSMETQVFTGSEGAAIAEALRQAAESAQHAKENLADSRPVEAGQVTELGLSLAQIQTCRKRLLNRDGTFNVERAGSTIFSTRSLYHYLMNISLWLFLGYIVSVYVSLNLLFASIYFFLGASSIDGSTASTTIERFFDCFFFSVQTFATIGYGKLTAHGIVPNLVATAEALVGMLTFALATGLFFARFSRPTAKILFSDKALISPYGSGKAFVFRVANARQNQILRPEARVVLSRLERQNKQLMRKFYELNLERSQVMFLPLNWTIVHPIEEGSPLWNITDAELRASQAEFMVLLSGTDDTFAQQVFAASSYNCDELVWNAKFKNILEEQESGIPRIDLRRLDEFEIVN